MEIKLYLLLIAINAVAYTIQMEVTGLRLFPRTPAMKSGPKTQGSPKGQPGSSSIPKPHGPLRTSPERSIGNRQGSRRKGSPPIRQQRSPSPAPRISRSGSMGRPHSPEPMPPTRGLSQISSGESQGSPGRSHREDSPMAQYTTAKRKVKDVEEETRIGRADLMRDIKTTKRQRRIDPSSTEPGPFEKHDRGKKVSRIHIQRSDQAHRAMRANLAAMKAAEPANQLPAETHHGLRASAFILQSKSDETKAELSTAKASVNTVHGRTQLMEHEGRSAASIDEVRNSAMIDALRIPRLKDDVADFKFNRAILRHLGGKATDSETNDSSSDSSSSSASR